MDNEMGFQKKHFDAVENLDQKPNRIESIKERLNNLGAGKVVKYDHPLNLATQYAIDYKNDVEWLMQRLERYERFVDHMPDLKRTIGVLQTEEGMIKWSYVSSMIDGYLEGFAQQALKENE